MSEYVILVSNIKSVSQFGKNTIAEFQTQLGRKFSLVGNLVVGITEVSYTKSWYNVLFPHKIILFDEMATIYDDPDLTETNNIEIKSEKLYVASGYYESAKKLVDEINAILAKITMCKQAFIILIYHTFYQNKLSFFLVCIEYSFLFLKRIVCCLYCPFN
jgi:hypothetical protein